MIKEGGGVCETHPSKTVIDRDDRIRPPKKDGVSGQGGETPHPRPVLEDTEVGIARRRTDVPLRPPTDALVTEVWPLRKE